MALARCTRGLHVSAQPYFVGDPPFVRQSCDPRWCEFPPSFGPRAPARREWLRLPHREVARLLLHGRVPASHLFLDRIEYRQLRLISRPTGPRTPQNFRVLRACRFVGHASGAAGGLERAAEGWAHGCRRRWF